MPAVAVMAGASLVMQGYSMYEGNKAAQASAADARATAAYNARVDEAEATQIEMDSTENTRAARRDASVYLSRQKAAYAASGVLMSGSPLAVQATTAGQLEQQILQERSNAQREAEKRRSAARMGILYGDSTARGIMAQNRVEMFRGGAQMLSTAASLYQSGAFSSGKKPPVLKTGAQFGGT